jgi:hypothetical protein
MFNTSLVIHHHHQIVTHYHQNDTILCQYLIQANLPQEMSLKRQGFLH